MPCLGVLVPAYNEQETIAQTLHLVLRQSCVYEIIVIDDGSTDGTAELVEQIAQKEPRITLLRHLDNRGKGAAIKSGLRQTRAPFVIIQDADLEYNPADYMRLLQPVREGQADAVYGSRFMRGSASWLSSWHRLQNWLITTASNLVTGARLTDEATCYKLFRKETLERLALEEERFGFCPEVTAKICNLKLRIIEVPISYNSRTHAAGKKLRIKDGFDALRCLGRYSLQNRLRFSRRKK